MITNENKDTSHTHFFDQQILLQYTVLLSVSGYPAPEHISRVYVTTLIPFFVKSGQWKAFLDLISSPYCGL